MHNNKEYFISSKKDILNHNDYNFTLWSHKFLEKVNLYYENILYEKIN